MSSSGHIQAMIDSLKKNRALLKNRKKFKGLGEKTDSNRKLVFNKTKDVDLKSFKRNLRKQEKKKKQKKLILLIASLILTLLLLYYCNILIGEFYSGKRTFW